MTNQFLPMVVGQQVHKKGENIRQQQNVNKIVI